MIDATLRGLHAERDETLRQQEIEFLRKIRAGLLREAGRIEKRIEDLLKEQA